MTHSNGACITNAFGLEKESFIFYRCGRNLDNYKDLEIPTIQRSSNNRLAYN